MIIIWLRLALAWLMKLFVPPPAIQRISINRDAQCPCCGHCQGKLLAVADADGVVFCQHQCQICNARWMESTLIRVPKDRRLILPAEYVNLPARWTASGEGIITDNTHPDFDPARHEAIMSATKQKVETTGGSYQ